MHIQSQQESYIKAEWGGDAYVSCLNSSSRGVMILLNNNFEYTVENVISDIKRNYIILDINIEGKKFTLINLYRPNNDKPNFLQGIKTEI